MTDREKLKIAIRALRVYGNMDMWQACKIDGKYMYRKFTLSPSALSVPGLEGENGWAFADQTLKQIDGWNEKYNSSNKKVKKEKRLLTGAELRFAAENKKPVYYIENYFNPMDEHMNFKGKCVMKQASSGYYIGNSDIDPEGYKDNELVEATFDEGFMKVCAIPGIIYKD